MTTDWRKSTVNIAAKHRHSYLIKLLSQKCNISRHGHGVTLSLADGNFSIKQSNAILFLRSVRRILIRFRRYFIQLGYNFCETLHLAEIKTT